MRPGGKLPRVALSGRQRSHARCGAPSSFPRPAPSGTPSWALRSKVLMILYGPNRCTLHAHAVRPTNTYVIPLSSRTLDVFLSYYLISPATLLIIRIFLSLSSPHRHAVRRAPCEGSIDS